MSERRHTCPICGENSSTTAVNRFFPFCSERCQLVDLSRWLDGDYRVPGQPSQSNYGDDDEEYM